MPAHNRTTNTYNWNHRRRRAHLLTAAIGTPCPGDYVNGQPWRSRNCHRIMTTPRHMHLAHTVPIALGGTTGDRINCSACNLGAGAILGNQLRGQRAHPLDRRTRTW
jgi:hypothetical protein